MSNLDKNALHYHQSPRPGKIEVVPTKQLSNQVDLSLAYSPGVAAPCLEIAKDPSTAALYTARSNLVAVITNGTAVLGLGNIGPLASKPVMEGKGVLFKKFAGVDVFDIEVDELDPDKFVDIVASLAPTFGGINLEDIKAPECFFIEQKLREKIDIPVFHDDQHGTAIITAAAMVNALEIVGKKIEEVRLVASGAGAAGIACLDLLTQLGLKKEHILVNDSRGIIYKGRAEGMDDRKGRYAAETGLRTLNEAIDGADIFLGVSKPGLLTQDMVSKMADKPIIFALANPTPEILPEEAKAVRPDAIIATGRSDYPNQVNNVLCFPYIFRGALDVGATTVNEEMKLACIDALAKLTRAEASDEVAAVYVGQSLTFGPEYLIPKPFDPRLIVAIPMAVAKAAMDSGVATKPIEDFDDYRKELERFTYKTGMVMKPVFEQAQADPKRIVYAEGENERILRAVQLIVDDGLAKPVLIGRKKPIQKKLKELGLRLQIDQDFELIDPEDNPYFDECWKDYWELRTRLGVSPELAQTRIRTRNTVLASVLVKRGIADGMICGTLGRYQKHLNHITDILELQKGVSKPSAMSVVTLPKGTFFICDTHVNQNPNAEEIAEMALLAAKAVKNFGITPKAALLSSSNFGSANTKEAHKMADALKLVLNKTRDFEIEGEMKADLALSETLRKAIMPDSPLQGEANLLIMPNLDAANIAFNLVRMLADGLSIGPVLLGVQQPAHILTPSASVRRILNMTALTTVEC
ncbi:MAG: NADP-dependent malic enzyme, partial [Gammaproteobacteria bacterium]